MKDAHFTRQERFCIHWLRFLTLVFLAALGFLTFFPGPFLEYLNAIGRVFFHYPSVPLSEPGWDVWRLFTLIFLSLLAVASYRAQKDWLQYWRFVPLLIFSKGLCFLGFLGLGFLAPPAFFYLVGALADGLLFLITWYAYHQALNSRSAITPHRS